VRGDASAIKVKGLGKTDAAKLIGGMMIRSYDALVAMEKPRNQ